MTEQSTDGIPSTAALIFEGGPMDGMWLPDGEMADSMKGEHLIRITSDEEDEGERTAAWVPHGTDAIN